MTPPTSFEMPRDLVVDLADLERLLTSPWPADERLRRAAARTHILHLRALVGCYGLPDGDGSVRDLAADLSDLELSLRRPPCPDWPDVDRPALARIMVTIIAMRHARGDYSRLRACVSHPFSAN